MDKEGNEGWASRGMDKTSDGPPTGRPDGEFEDGHPVISTERARQGVTLHAMRYVLGVSISLVVVVFAVAYLLTVVFRH
jgi:hypothetical protein